MNMNDTIDPSGISADNIYRIRRSKAEIDMMTIGVA